MTRQQQIVAAERPIVDGRYKKLLSTLVSYPTVSGPGKGQDALYTYLNQALGPIFSDMGFQWSVLDNPIRGGGPFLIAERVEDSARPTVLSYGHADVVEGMEGKWSKDRNPFVLTETSDRLYGRGTADNKGQHLLNLMALHDVLKAKRGKLGFNCKFLIETSEETGSIGLEKFVAENATKLSADVLIASDGPRIAPDIPTVVLGLRGVMNFSLEVSLRSDAHHSGNWGGIIADPFIVLANAVSAICSSSGVIRVPGWRPTVLTDMDRKALADCPYDVGESPDLPDEDWGEPSLGLWEKLALWPSFSVLAVEHGNTRTPQNAIYPCCVARCGIRFPASLDPEQLMHDLQEFLINHGYEQVKVIRNSDDAFMAATKGDPEGQWAYIVARSVEQSLAMKPRVLPSNGGSLPNYVFKDILGLETIWIPHSYNACQQHAPDEHVRKDILKSGMKLMTGLWWDIGTLSDIKNEVHNET